ncbi:MAG: glycosyltransferase family 4 protein [Candidatus Pacebacteria bacterium]|jgi:glycosyltransferase involved in cell wall biosynthesis|nr:glycosyltransferase family 4 protein [Candidatus Paceibacterota bacterium]MBT3511662.1 glycosyltransferase family 4 protein [Candidatus Paceibacterota bacterium]MBT4004489.1 glycosyltransferase family 4 protein [Candidatus Paceibacterota bacterium]MBT4358821.1 glycosyltransferase family 4 protein [Candidatus Paceibacterota bacterium]MBT4680645.1 glycosyltransferase family 4 protein [Candidatus Paceibacterota bacterium]
MPTTAVIKTKPVKILQITPFYEPRLGGVETHVNQVSKELIKQGHQVSVLTQLHDSSLPAQETINRVEVNRIDLGKNYDLKLIEKLTVWQQVAKHSQLLLKADIIHVHDVYWWLLPLLPLFWSKIYLTFHGWEGQFPVPFKNKLARWCWSKLALKTIHVGDYIQEFYWDKPDLVIYGGVINDQLKAKKIGKKIHIVFVGRLEAENDLEKYLTLAKKLKSILDIKITWVGDGFYREECERYGQVTGMVTDLTKYISKADLVWSASYLSILEAQAQGKIVCALYSQQLKERYLKSYPGSTYMLVSTSEEQLKKQILELLDNTLVLDKYSRQARLWAQQQTWKKIADQYQQLWELK